MFMWDRMGRLALLALIALLLGFRPASHAGGMLLLARYPDGKEYPSSLKYLDLAGLRVYGRGNFTLLALALKAPPRKNSLLWGRIELNLPSSGIPTIKITFEGTPHNLRAALIYGNLSRKLRARTTFTELLFPLDSRVLGKFNLTELFAKGSVKVRVKFVTGLKDRMDGRLILMSNGTVSEYVFEDRSDDKLGLPGWNDVRRVKIIIWDNGTLEVTVRFLTPLPLRSVRNWLLFFRQECRLEAGKHNLTITLGIDVHGGVRPWASLKGDLGSLGSSARLNATLEGGVLRLRVPLDIEWLKDLPSLYVGEAWSMYLDLIPKGYLKGLWASPTVTLSRMRRS